MEVPEAVLGTTSSAKAPLDMVQIDHTPAGLILVDPIERRPIGRPWVTTAIDVFSRCITGFHVTLEAPSSTSVGLCLAHVASDKRCWLDAIGANADWPRLGRPSSGLFAVYAAAVGSTLNRASQSLSRGRSSRGGLAATSWGHCTKVTFTYAS
jgi:transposase InsO family protein